MVLATVLLLTVSFASPVFAADPPGTEVNVGVVTAGDVDLDVGITAGGNVNVTVGGVDLQLTAAMARDAYEKANSPHDGFFDFNYYWNRTGIGGWVSNTFDNVWQAIELIINAQAKLIQELESANARIDALEARLAELEQ